MYLVGLYLALFLSSCLGSHFRGGIIMWKPTANHNEVTVDFRISWRKSYDHRTNCDSTVVASRTLIGPNSENLECFSGCSGIISSMDYHCTDFSNLEDWSAGERSVTYTFPERSGHFYEFGFRGNAWITLVSGGGNWELRTTANLTRRSDTGQVNSSPVTAMQPIVRIQHGCNASIAIPVHDDDGDFVRCRWSTGSKGECGGICDAFQDAILYQKQCKIDYAATGQIGWYAVAVQIEDFAQKHDTEPLSSVPLQFLVNVFTSSTNQCADRPTFVKPTRVDGSCIGVPFNTIFSEPLIAKSGTPSMNISEINTVSPVGMIKSNLAPYNIVNGEWYANVTWSPKIDQQGSNVFCFSAVDTSGLTSRQNCVTLLGGVKPPEIVRDSLFPVGAILPTNRKWSLEFDIEFVQPSREAYISFYKADGQLMHNVDVSKMSTYPRRSLSRTLLLDVTLNLVEKEHYYVLMDPGVAIGTTLCGAESPPITDPSFWSVRVRDTTPPQLRFIYIPSETNENMTIVWAFNEEVTTTCTIQAPNSTDVTECNNTWVGEDLVEGYYTIYIEGTDLENNTGAVVQRTWKVYRTGPFLIFYNKPSSNSNETSVNFQFICNENCTTVCALHKKLSPPVFAPCAGGFSRAKKSFDTGTLQENVHYVFQAMATDVVGNEGDVHTFEWQTDFTAPVIQKLPKISVTCGSDHSPNVTGMPNITDNLDHHPVVYYDDKASSTCGVLREWTATDAAGNSGSMHQQITFTSPRPAKVQFPRNAQVPCGDLDIVTKEVMMPSVKVIHPCNLPVNISFIDPNGDGQCGVTFNRTWQVTDDCEGSLRYFQLIKMLEPQIPLTPQNGQTNIDLGYMLRWPIYPGSVSFKVFLWKANMPKPSTPTAITDKPGYILSKSLDFQPGENIFWQIEFGLKNNETIPSPRWEFQTRKYPDVIVASITTPPIAFSGQSFGVRWTVRNIGNSMTQAHRWYDAVFISFTGEFNRARRTAVVMKKNMLLPGDGYTGNTQVALRDDEFGQLYVFVRTDYYNDISDLNATNNLRKADTVIEVKLTPPPDLRVDLITVPQSTYSGQEIAVSYTVNNHGSGVTSVSRWNDEVYWSGDSFYNTSDMALARIRRNHILQPAESYTSKVNVMIPRQIFGVFYIAVKTDINNEVFEYASEDNNIAVSNGLQVILSPPPDLRVTGIQVGNSFSTGDMMDIRWTVDNDGETPYQHAWFDRIVLRSVDAMTTRVLGTIPFSGEFPHGYNYTRSIVFIVSPNIPDGQYNLTVYIDYMNEIFEYDKKSNNMKSVLITVTQTLPDLSVDMISAAVTSTDTENVLNMTWTVKNIGTGNTTTALWRDALYVTSASRTLQYDVNIIRNKALLVQRAYQLSYGVTLPISVYGPVNIKLLVDRYYQTADSDRHNNEREYGPVDVPLIANDIELVEIYQKHAGDILSGSQLSFSWTISNKGTSIPENAVWQVKIILSRRLKTLYPNLVSETVLQNGPLRSGQNYITNYTIKVPETEVGAVFLHVIINPTQNIFEGPYTKNNAKYLQLDIRSAPSPDFSVKELNATVITSTAASQNILVVSWTVINLGNTMNTARRWVDSVYLGYNMTKHLEIIGETLNLLESFNIYAALETQQSYSMMKQILLHRNTVGKIYVYLFTDSMNNVVEFNAEDNNVRYYEHAIKINNHEAAKLSVSVNALEPSSSQTFFSGKEMWIHYEVNNTGSEATCTTSWNDEVYLANSENLDKTAVLESGVKVKVVNHIGMLFPQESYSMNISITVPYELPGNSFVYVFTNIESGEASTASCYSNTNSINGFVSSQKFVTVQDNLPNIFPTIHAQIAQKQGGEPYTLEYNVSNDGETSWSGHRYDAVYISDDIVLDPFDQKLESALIKTHLDVNETILESVTVFIPYNLKTKNYFLIVAVDARNDIYELNEQDNLADLALNIIEVITSDIAVLDVTASHNVTIGDTMIMNWNIINYGSQVATGYVCDTAYLSSDAVWDIKDEQIGDTMCGHRAIRPFNYSTGYNETISSLVPLLSDGTYTAVVKTRSNIFDSYLENNIGFANKMTYISVEKIYLGNIISCGFINSSGREYLIPDVPADKSLIVKVTGTNMNTGINVKLKFRAPATDFDFDVTSANPTKTNQTVVLQNTREGDYYILLNNAESSSTGLLTTKITLEVKLAHFEILTTMPTKASKQGNVTVRLDGTLFPEDAKAVLFNNNRSLNAFAVYHFSSTLVYATFDMTTSVFGEIFSVRVSSLYLNRSTSLPDVLEIVHGIPGKIKASISVPSALRPGENALVYIDVFNEGDTDILAPIIVVGTNEIGHLKFVSNLKITDYEQRHVMVVGSSQGPGGILPPREYCRLQFEAKQIDTNITGNLQVTVSVIDTASNDEHIYVSMKENMKISHYNDIAWTKVWNNFLEYVGISWSSLHWKVSQISTQMSVAGRRIYELSDFISFMLDMADSPNVDDIITNEVDLKPTTADLPEVILDLHRHMPAKTGLRELTGVFGRGWIAPLWDTNLQAISPIVARLRLDKVDYLFMSTEVGIYDNNVLGKMVICNSTIIFTDKHSEKDFTFEITSGKLLSVTSNRDSSQILLQYDSERLIKKVIHSNGAFMNITYDDAGRIVTVLLKNDTTGNEQQVDYSYDRNANLLSSVDIDGKTLSYKYFSDGYLKTITRPNGQVQVFQYSSNGHLSYRIIAAENTTLAKMEYIYDGAAKTTRHVYPADTGTTYTFDEFGNVASINMNRSLTQRFLNTLNTRSIYEGDMVVTYELYDRNKNTMYLEDGNGDSMKVIYDSKGRVYSLTDAGGNIYSVERNENGTLKTIVFPDKCEENYFYRPYSYKVVARSAVTKQFNFDNSGRVVWKDSGNDEVTAYRYDATGNMISSTNQVGMISISYDANSYPRSIEYPNGKSIHYEYSDRGVKTGISFSADYQVSYVYNDKGKLTDVLDKVTGTTLMHAEYYISGHIKLKRLGNGAYTMYTYTHNNGLLKRQDNYFPNGSLSSTFGYQYDIRNRRISLHTTQGDWKFRYDTSGQVTYIKRPDGHETQYSYDSRKNRRSVKVNDETKVYKRNNMNQYVTYGNEQSFAHDKNGNLIQVNGTKFRKYTFDEDNKLTRFQTPGASCTLIYDGIGSLYKKLCRDETIQYLVDQFGKNGPDVLAELSSTGQDRYYYHGGNQLGLVAMKGGNEFYYYQFDPLGTVTCLLDKDGGLMNSYTVEPFGKNINYEETIHNPFTFIGQWGVMKFEDVEELYYMRARFYDAQHGRFLSADPLGMAGKSPNFYVYAYNNPVHYNDPKGTFVPLVLGTLNVAMYAGVQYLTGGDITLGGAVSSFTTGLIGGAAGQKVVGMAAKVAFGAANSAFGYATQTAIDHEAFNWESFGTSVLNGMATSLLPAKTPAGVSSFLSNSGSFLGDPTKSLSKKWQQVKKTWQERSEAIKEAYGHVKRFAKDLEKDAKDIIHKAEKGWHSIMRKVRELKRALTRWIRSLDPNDIIGPPGYGSARFVAKASVLEYKIRFENDENATAPAQRVFIDHTFDSDIDPHTFKIGAFGFGSHIHEIDKASSYLQTKVNMTEQYGIFLGVRAGIDVVLGKATWEFQSLDPETGSPPENPQVGFLPPNNGTVGQGFVTFSVKSHETALNLARLDAKASIYFDKNEPIDTPAIFNTIDSVAPHVNATVIEEILSSGTLALSLNTYDDGSGFKDVDILLRKDDGLEMLMTGVNESAVVLPVPPGRTYDFVFSPVDYVGNRPSTDDALLSMIKIPFGEIEVSCVKVNNCSGHGNCSGPGVCICEEGFYGESCSSDTPPAEPPILELMSPGGYENEMIPVHVLAKLVDGNVSDYLSVTLEGFPNGTVFSKGVLSDSLLSVDSSEFGDMNVTFPYGFAETVTFLAKARYTKGNSTLVRNGVLVVVITPAVFELTLSDQPLCFHISETFSELYLNVTTRLDGAFQNATASITLKIPLGYHSTNVENVREEPYVFNQTKGNALLKITLPTHYTMIPLRIRVTAEVRSDLQPDKVIRKFQEAIITTCLDVSKTATLLMPVTDTTTVITSTSTSEKRSSTKTSTTLKANTLLVSSVNSPRITNPTHIVNVTLPTNIRHVVTLSSTGGTQGSSTESDAETSHQQKGKRTLTIIMSSVGAFVGVVVVTIVVRFCMAKKSRSSSTQEMEDVHLNTFGNADYAYTRSSKPPEQMENPSYSHSTDSVYTRVSKPREETNRQAYSYSRRPPEQVENPSYSHSTDSVYTRVSKPQEETNRQAYSYSRGPSFTRSSRPSDQTGRRSYRYSNEILLQAK